MKVAVIGGKLQGTEACYLAKQAGMESILIDKNPLSPAGGIADVFICADLIKRDKAAMAALKEADFVLPANENDELLKTVCEICREEGLKLAFDPEAYDISRSKTKTNALMKQWNIPMPLDYPEGNPPYIIKPSGESGSKGVRYAKNRTEAERIIKELGITEENRDAWVIQEFIEGPSYSIEVIGVPGNYRTYAVTEIHMDQAYDCCKVTAPCRITQDQERSFSDTGKKLAEMINLHGIMDVEVMEDSSGCFRVLEIDARIPSQTPVVVLRSSGMNLLKELADITVNREFRDLNFAEMHMQEAETDPENIPERKYAVYEHYRKAGDRIIQDGEHELAIAGPLNIRENFLGAREVISDIQSQNILKDTEDDSDTVCGDFRGVFINWADSEEELERQRRIVKEKLLREG